MPPEGLSRKREGTHSSKAWKTNSHDKGRSGERTKIGVAVGKIEGVPEGGVFSRVQGQSTRFGEVGKSDLD